MDTEGSYISLLLEFFEVCFHSILFSRKIYPESIFTLKKKYNIPVHISLFPDLNQYISDVLMSVKYFLASNHLKQLSLLILDSSLNPIEKFVFNNFYFDPSKLTRPMQQSEVHIIELQRIFRSFLLKLSTSDRTLKPTQHNSSFKIYVKIDEQTFMNTSGETNFEISLFPDLNQYISDVLMSVKYFLASNHLKQLSLLILDSSLNPIEKFVFNNFYFDPSKLTRPMQQSEVHIIELQRIFRSFLLKLSTSDRTLKPTQHNSSFKIYVKIDEQTFMNTSGETNFEKFPWIAQDYLQDHNLKKVFPLQTIKTTFCHFEIFVEL